jgi:hypothetical protein
MSRTLDFAQAAVGTLVLIRAWGMHHDRGRLRTDADPDAARTGPGARHQMHILKQCAEWIDAGQLELHVSRVFPLEQAAAAHRQIETGHTLGKLVLRIN